MDMKEFGQFFELENEWQGKQAAAEDAGRAWMDQVLADEGTEPWAELTYPEFKQAVANANAPAFPHHQWGPTDSDEDILGLAAIQAAWDELQARIENA